MSRNSPEQHRGLPEERLAEIRRQASQFGRDGPGGPSHGNIPKATADQGYYGLPLLKPPQWKWEVPAYLFTGGLAGAAAVIAGVGELCQADRQLVRDARWLAALSGAACPPFLIADLGKPSRFLSMLRVFKVRSPMSVGSWILLVFSGAAATALLTEIARERGLPLPVIGAGSRVLATIAGLPLTSYTGVLLGATAVPVWSASAAGLPIHFAASGLGAAVSLLELNGHELEPSLNRLGIGSAITETVISVRSTAQRNPALKAVKSGRAGWISRTGAFLSGPLPLALRLIAGSARPRRSLRLRQVAALSAITGSMLTRYGWVDAGQASVRDPAASMQRKLGY